MSLARAMKNIPRKLESQLQTLVQLDHLLVEIQAFCTDSAASVDVRRLKLLELWVKGCHDAIDCNVSLIEIQLTPMQTQNMVRRRTAKLKSVLKSKEINGLMDELRWKFEGLQLVYLSFLR